MDTELLSFMGSLQCKGCGRSWHGLDVRDKGFYPMIREAYAKGWVTTCVSRYDGGDGVHRAFCPNCASSHTKGRYLYEPNGLTEEQVKRYFKG